MVQIFFTKFFGDYSGTGGGPEHWRKLGIDWFFVRTMCRVRQPGGEQQEIWELTQQIGKCKFDNLKACCLKASLRSIKFNVIELNSKNISNLMDKCLVKTNWGSRGWLAHNMSDYPSKDQSERERPCRSREIFFPRGVRVSERRTKAEWDVMCHWDARYK